jgi:hypothetical protein
MLRMRSTFSREIFRISLVVELGLNGKQISSHKTYNVRYFQLRLYIHALRKTMVSIHGVNVSSF